MGRDLLAFDRDQLDTRSAAIATVALAAIVGVTIAFGGAAMAAAFGFVITALVWRTAGQPTWGRASGVAVVGGLLSLVAGLSAGDPAWSAAALGGVALVSSLPRTRFGAVAWPLLALWTLIAVLTVDPSWALAAGVGFVLGSVVASSVFLTMEGAAPSTQPLDLGRMRTFAMIKGAAVAVAVLVGFWLFPDVPYWVALTVMIVARPGSGATTTVALQRTVGTLAGVGIGVFVELVIGDSVVAAVVALAVIVFGQMLFLEANYTIYATFLTAVVVVGASLVGAEATDVGWDRVWATLLGAAMAIGPAALATTRQPG